MTTNHGLPQPQTLALVPEARSLPGPRGEFLLGSLRERRRDPLGLYSRGAREYGDMVGFRMGPLRVALVNDPVGIKRVLVDNAKNYPKGFLYEVLKPALGHGLLTSDGEHWRAQRRLVQPAFHRGVIAGLVQTISLDVKELLTRWTAYAERGDRFDLAREMNRLTLSVVSRTLLGSDISGNEDEVGAALSQMLEDMNVRMLSIVRTPLSWPTPRNRSIRKPIAFLDQSVL